MRAVRRRGVPRRSPKVGARNCLAPDCGAPKCGAPKGGVQKISRFFFLLPPPFSFFFSLLESFRGIGGVIESRDPQMCTFGVLGLSCEAPAAQNRQGFTRQPVHISGSRPSKTPQKTPRETQKSEMEGGRGGVGAGVKGSAQILDEPTNTTQQHNNYSTGLGQGGSIAGWSMVPKTRHEQQIVPKSSAIGQCFLGSRMVRTGLGTKRFDQKKLSGPRGGLGQKWCGPKVVRAKSGQKNQKTWEKQIKK